MQIRCLLALLALAFAARPAAAAAPASGRLAPPPPESEANGPSADPEVSGDGLVFVFASAATNWVPRSFTGEKIVAVDLADESVESLSTTAEGLAFNGGASSPSTAGNRRYVAFETFAINLGLPVATSGFQILRTDRLTGGLVLANANAAVVPASDSASGQARNASISADGRFVLFQTNAAEIVNGVAGGTIQVYLRDREAGITERISASTGGAAANSQSEFAAISRDGRFVSFRSFANNLGDSGFLSRVYVRDRVAGTTTPVPLPMVSGATASGCRDSDVSNAGTGVLSCFFGSLFDQVFLHVAAEEGTPFLLSSDAADVPGNQISGAVVAIDDDGSALAFASRASNLDPEDASEVSDIFVLVPEPSAALASLAGLGALCALHARRRHAG